MPVVVLLFLVLEQLQLCLSLETKLDADLRESFSKKLPSMKTLFIASLFVTGISFLGLSLYSKNRLGNVYF